jgi:hypothetical protein
MTDRWPCAARAEHAATDPRGARSSHALRRIIVLPLCRLATSRICAIRQKRDGKAGADVVEAGLAMLALVMAAL